MGLFERLPTDPDPASEHTCQPGADGYSALPSGKLPRQNGQLKPSGKSMHTVLTDGSRALLSVTIDELEAIKRALEAAGHTAGRTDADYVVEFGVSRQAMQILHAALCVTPPESRSATELVEAWEEAWEESGAVMVRAMNTFGDPVELHEVSTGEYLQQLQRAVNQAS